MPVSASQIDNRLHLVRLDIEKARVAARAIKRDSLTQPATDCADALQSLASALEIMQALILEMRP